MIGFLSSVWKGQNHFIFLLKFRIHLRATIILATISVFCCLGFNGSESVSLIISIWEHLKIQCYAIAAVGGSSCLWGISGMKVQILFWNTTDIFPSREHLFFPGFVFLCDLGLAPDSVLINGMIILDFVILQTILSVHALNWSILGFLILHLCKTDRTDK